MEAPADGGEKGPASPIVVAAGEETESTNLTSIEAAQKVWGKTGRRLVLDNSTVYTYGNYATSDFDSLSLLGTLSTANTIIFAVCKPPLAKLSDAIGRGQVLTLCVACYLLSYILKTTATSIGAYAAGGIFYAIGQSGTNVMTNVLISDITTFRHRGFAIGISYFPFLISPWVAALIVDSVVKEGGIGWRWGIGMLGFLMPFGASFIIITLFYYERKAKKAGILKPKKRTLAQFCGEVDLGGMLFFVAGFACLLLPLTLAGSQPAAWSTPWIIALMIVGVVILVALPFYEKHYATNPIVPVSYLKNSTVVLCCLLMAIDSVGFSATHTYLYAWGIVVHGMQPLVANFYVYTNGVTQTFSGIIAGAIMWYTGRYKWLVMAGSVLRLIGYGIMVMLRGQFNSTGELFGQQLIQGFGSGIIATCLIIPPQLVVPKTQMAQVLALVFSFSFLGSSVGSSIAGAIYTNTMKPSLRAWLGDSASSELVDTIYDSITGELPAWNSPDRIAINYAYSDVLRYITYAAIGTCVPAIIMTVFLPNLELPKSTTGMFKSSEDTSSDDVGTTSVEGKEQKA
ncbi:siderochrome-iron transporter [Microdochium trichocladiopsis]|uniref:Siderochrome-iron transporter n=1 Tax=Microdochium trichocladiopsis TaxID=1682393 RepID=A0A9P8Y7P4_9PEZI|nr:siderochrome-iron transporter [Microdochium trichocladiopsis]KAH7029908.1 siderochrome-iron transporter [Microdochium trichocladiopsis]